MNLNVPKILKSAWFIALVCFVLGAVVILAIRFFTYKPADKVHYHANFDLYINGQRELFKAPYYYEEIATMCNDQQQITPHDRAHMHDNVNDVVHVEDHAVTWGQFFQNLGWVVDFKVIRSPDQIYLADDQHPITFILNGKQQANIVNTVIQDKDRLLVDYGTTSQPQLQQEFSGVPHTAVKYDTQKDPATCSGSKPTSTSERLKHLF